MVLNQELVSPRIPYQQRLDTFLVVTTEGEGDYCIQWIEVGDAVTHPAMLGPLTNTDLLGPNVNPAKVEKACSSDLWPESPVIWGHLNDQK